MTLVHEDIAATRRAVVDLERRAASLVRHFGDTVDAATAKRLTRAALDRPVDQGLADERRSPASRRPGCVGRRTSR